ncbi:hypothetical protein [Thalassotalea ganghwensis]
MKQVIVSLMLLVMSFSVVSKERANQCDSKCQTKEIVNYFAALDNISRKGSTEKDIENLLSRMHDEVKYIHVEYQANFDKATWRKAFMRNLNKGAYQRAANEEKRVLNTIYGKNHVAIEYANGKVLANGEWQQDEPLLVLFGFKEGKISLIKELW